MSRTALARAAALSSAAHERAWQEIADLLDCASEALGNIASTGNGDARISTGMRNAIEVERGKVRERLGEPVTIVSVADPVREET